MVNKYTYNYKELNEDFGLNWHDYGARWYDAALGRWWSVDPLAEPQANYSPYAYTYNKPLSFIDPTGMMGEGADGLSNEQWLDQSRKDGGYWAGAKAEMTQKEDGEAQMIEDFEGGKHQVTKEDYKKTKSTPYGTRIETAGGVILSNRLEGYHIEEVLEEPSICPPCIVIIVAILATAPEVATNSTGNYEADAKAIQNAQSLKKEWLSAGLTAPVRAEGYAVQAVSKKLMIKSSEDGVRDNFKRFIGKIPANAKTSATIEHLSDGSYLFSALSPGKVPGSSALYQKWVDAMGQTTRMIKTTFAPDGSIVHIKTKF